MKKIVVILSLIFYVYDLNAQIENINEYTKFDLLIKSNSQKTDTVVIYGKYVSYRKNMLSKELIKKLKIKTVKTAIKFSLFETNNLVSYPLLSKINNVIYKKNDFIKLQIIIFHDIHDEKNQKICVVEKVL